MPLDFQLEALWSSPKVLTAGVVVLAIIAQSLYEKRKRASEGRAPMVSHLAPWVGSALEIGGDPDAFFVRAQWVTMYLCVVAILIHPKEEVWRRVRHEGVWEGCHVRRVSIGVSLSPKAMRPR